MKKYTNRKAQSILEQKSVRADDVDFTVNFILGTASAGHGDPFFLFIPKEEDLDKVNADRDKYGKKLESHVKKDFKGKWSYEKSHGAGGLVVEISKFNFQEITLNKLSGLTVVK